MKRLLPICLAAAALSPTANAQRFHDPYPAEHCEHERLDCLKPTGRPVIDRLRRDFCMIRGELDRGFFEVRHELRRAFDGRSYRGEPVVYYSESDRPYAEPQRFEDPSYRADESYGRFSEETLDRTRRRATEREREFELQRQRARELAERTAPQGRRRPAELEPDPAPTRPRREAPVYPQPPPEIEAASEPAPQVPLERDPVDPVTLPDRDQPDPSEGGYTEAQKRNFPLATKTDRPGFVRSPYPPFELLDVTGIAPGDLAMEPESERVFRVPK